VTLIFFIQSGC